MAGQEYFLIFSDRFMQRTDVRGRLFSPVGCENVVQPEDKLPEWR
jgi:hypothetical protein